MVRAGWAGPTGTVCAGPSELEMVRSALTLPGDVTLHGVALNMHLGSAKTDTRRVVVGRPCATLVTLACGSASDVPPQLCRASVLTTTAKKNDADLARRVIPTLQRMPRSTSVPKDWIPPEPARRSRIRPRQSQPKEGTAALHLDVADRVTHSRKLGWRHVRHRRPTVEGGPPRRRSVPGT